MILSLVTVSGFVYWAFFSDYCGVNNIQLREGDELRWTGECRFGKANGKGLMTWVRNKKSYQQFRGTYRYGVKEGHGEYFWANGTRYFGQYHNDLRHGKGTYIWPDKSRYEGQFVEGKKQGKGFFLRADGLKYYGTFSNDLPNGKGIEIDSNGVRYEGEFVNGLKHGVGIETGTDYSRYEGQFVHGKREGDGTLSWADGSSYQGQFVGGKRQGKGVMRWQNGDVYEGEFVNDLKHGSGVYVWADKSRYEGQYDQDYKHGKGTLIWRNGVRYTGDFFEDKKSGYGVESDPRGFRYEGQFLNNQKHGQGKFKWPDGTTYVGQFLFDLRHGKGTYIWPDGGYYKGANQKDLFHGQGELVIKRSNPSLTQYLGKGEWISEDAYLVRGYWLGGELSRSFSGGQSTAANRADLKQLNGKQTLTGLSTMGAPLPKVNGVSTKVVSRTQVQADTTNKLAVSSTAIKKTLRTKNTEPSEASMAGQSGSKNNNNAVQDGADIGKDTVTTTEARLSQSVSREKPEHKGDQSSGKTETLSETKPSDPKIDPKIEKNNDNRHDEIKDLIDERKAKFATTKRKVDNKPTKKEGKVSQESSRDGKIISGAKPRTSRKNEDVIVEDEDGLGRLIRENPLIKVELHPVQPKRDGRSLLENGLSGGRREKTHSNREKVKQEIESKTGGGAKDLNQKPNEATVGAGQILNGIEKSIKD